MTVYEFWYIWYIYGIARWRGKAPAKSLPGLKESHVEQSGGGRANIQAVMVPQVTGSQDKGGGYARDKASRGQLCKYICAAEMGMTDSVQPIF